MLDAKSQNAVQLCNTFAYARVLAQVGSDVRDNEHDVVDGGISMKASEVLEADMCEHIF